MAEQKITTTFRLPEQSHVEIDRLKRIWGLKTANAVVEKVLADYSKLNHEFLELRKMHQDKMRELADLQRKGSNFLHALRELQNGIE